MLNKLRLCSGGQTGADLAGLWVGRALGLTTGGFAPKGFRTQAGPQLALSYLFGLRETEDSSYVERTRLNVERSDLTLVVGSNLSSPGTALTIKTAHAFKRPLVQVLFDPAELGTVASGPYFDSKVEELGKVMIKHVLLHDDVLLNVAGNSTQTSTRAFEATFTFLFTALARLNQLTWMSDPAISRLGHLLKDSYSPVDAAILGMGTGSPVVPKLYET